MFGMTSAVHYCWIFGLVAFVVRVVAAIVAGGFDQPEPFEYEYAARELIQGRALTYPHLGITYYSFLPPLYAWICAGIYLLTDGLTSAVLLAQMFISAVQTVLIVKLSGRLMGSIAGFSSGILFAFHPGLIVYSSLKLHPLVFDSFFFTLLLWQFVRLSEDGSLMRFIGTGLVGGLGILSRSTTAILLPLGCLWLLVTSVSKRQEWLPLIGRCVLVGVCATIVLTPWTIRNSRIHQEFVPVPTTAGEVFWRGNNPHATGHSYVNSNQIVLDTLSAAEREELRSLPSEIDQSNWFRERAFAFISDNPAEFLRLTAAKFYYFWWFSPQSGTEYPRSWFLVYQGYYIFLIGFALAGLWAIWYSGGYGRRCAMLLVVFMLGISVAQSFYYVEGRHRWGVEPLLLILVGGGIAHVVRTRTDLRIGEL